MGTTHNSIDIVQAGTVLTRKTSGINLPLLYPSAVAGRLHPRLNFSGSHINSANSPNFTSVGARHIHNYNTTIDISDNVGKVTAATP